MVEEKEKVFKKEGEGEGGEGVKRKKSGREKRKKGNLADVVSCLK